MLLIQFVVLQIADAVTTLVFLQHGVDEANVRSYSAEHQRVEVPPQEDIGMPE